MRDSLLVIDVQKSFSPPPWLVDGISGLLLSRLPSVATVERHDEAKVPFQSQLGWAPAINDESVIAADRVFVKHGYCPPPELIEHLHALRIERVFVCGIQAETCVLAAGFALFDAGLRPTLVADLVVGSSLDRSGALGIRLWRHHFGAVTDSHQVHRVAPVRFGSS